MMIIIFHFKIKLLRQLLLKELLTFQLIKHQSMLINHHQFYQLNKDQLILLRSIMWHSFHWMLFQKYTDQFLRPKLYQLSFTSMINITSQLRKMDWNQLFKMERNISQLKKHQEPFQLIKLSNQQKMVILKLLKKEITLTFQLKSFQKYSDQHFWRKLFLLVQMFLLKLQIIMFLLRLLINQFQNKLQLLR